MADKENYLDMDFVREKQISELDRRVSKIEESDTTLNQKAALAIIDLQNRLLRVEKTLGTLVGLQEVKGE